MRAEGPLRWPASPRTPRPAHEGAHLLAGRFGLAILVLALGDRFAQQPHRSAADGTVPAETRLFAGLVIVTVLVVGALSYVPVLALGPVVEHPALISARWGAEISKGVVPASSS